MDPNAVLAALRAWIAETRAVAPRDRATRAELRSAYEQAVVGVEHFEALDTWMKCGGFLPTAWNTEGERMPNPDRAPEDDVEEALVRSAVAALREGQTPEQVAEILRTGFETTERTRRAKPWPPENIETKEYDDGAKR